VFIRRNYADAAVTAEMTGCGITETSDSASGGANTWERLELMGVPTLTGCVELTVKCKKSSSGTTYVYVDDISPFYWKDV
jgi:hypothetical protein